MNYRYELKYYLNSNKDHLFQVWIRKFKDYQKTYDSRVVNSLYFDTIFLRSANDNIMGISNRQKYRIRWYGESFDTNVNIEIKNRNGRIGSKILIPTDLKLDQINLKKLFNNNKLLKKNIHFDKLNSDVYINNLKPVLYVKYTRHYFKIGKNLRVTYDICPKYKLSDDLNHNLKMKYLEDEINIIEIKFLEEHLEEARLILKKVPFVAKRHSKYLRGLAKCGLASYI